MENKVYYKLTSRDMGSYIIPKNNFHYTKYELNEFVKAKIGGLLVFGSLSYAREWHSWNLGVRGKLGKLWKCECKEQVKLPVTRLSLYKIYKRSPVLEELWNSYKYDHYFLEWPLSTLAFKQVKLLEEI